MKEEQHHVNLRRTKPLTKPQTIYLALGVALAALSWSEWLYSTPASGKWAWLQLLAEAHLGAHGYAKAMAIASIVWFIVFCISYYFDRDTTQGNNK